MKYLLVLVTLVLTTGLLFAQEYNLLLKGGHIIDPKNKINAVMDIAVKDGVIAEVSKSIPVAKAKQVVNVKGFYITPGLIDIHGHVFAGTTQEGDLSDGFSSLHPDGHTFRVGVTTIVDAGGPGANNFDIFKKNIIDRSRTRVLAFLNISSAGMKGHEYTEFQQDVKYFDSALAAETAKKYKDYIVGIKVAHFHSPDFIAVDRTVEAGRLADMPIMVDFGGSKPRLSIEELFMKRMRPGDIFTHTYGELLETKEAIVDIESGKLKPFVLAARDRGIIFDVGHGGGSFRYSQAIPAIKAGLFPHTISTDLHTGSMNGAMKDMLNVMAKFMTMGMSLTEVINASTWKPAQVINREELGHLSVGAVADIAVLGIRKGQFGFYDVARYKQIGNQKFECEMTIKGGNIVFDLNAIAIPTPGK